MKLNHTNHTIEMSKKEAAKISKFDSDEFENLTKLKNLFPNYKVVIEKTKRKTHRFSKPFIQTYVMNHGDKRQKEEFEKYESDIAKKDQDKCNNNYLKLRAWFMNEFGENFGIKTKAKGEKEKEENNKSEEENNNKEDAA